MDDPTEEPGKQSPYLGYIQARIRKSSVKEAAEKTLHRVEVKLDRALRHFPTGIFYGR